MKRFVSMSSLLVAGCVITQTPPHDVGFGDAESLRAFEGCYNNCSVDADGGQSVCLSSLLWPDRFHDEGRPDSILVKAEGDQTLVVSGFQYGVQVVASRFVEGEQFNFSGGQLHLEREYGASGATEPGNFFLGVATGKTVIGLDKKGEGRVVQSGTFLGTGFLIVPIAGHVHDVGKIRRIEVGCK